MRADATASEHALLRPGWQDRDLAALIADYRRDGFAVLRGVASPAALEAMRQRSDDLMLGRVDGAPFFFQHDAPTGRYEDMPLGEGWIGPSLGYRKLEKLERDPVFRAWLENPLFERIARTLVGDQVALYRAILMTKPARGPSAAGGTVLPWHQDGGRLWGLDNDPEVQLWTALDDAPLAAGCMTFAIGSHHAGLATPLGGAVPPDVVARAAPTLREVALPAAAGDVVLLHNMVWHASGLNATELPRRAFSVCFMPAATRCVRKKKAPRTFPRVFAPRAPDAAD
ncbi:MAG: phytanoyl-CoA dioxygenase family protein [Myxococcota bacterium]